jgi:hypothetical protein
MPRRTYLGSLGRIKGGGRLNPMFSPRVSVELSHTSIGYRFSRFIYKKKAHFCSILVLPSYHGSGFKGLSYNSCFYKFIPLAFSLLSESIGNIRLYSEALIRL